MRIGADGLVRVVGGSARGRRLRGIKGRGVRPTQDRVKEALFNILGMLVRGALVLDAYAGTGAIGIEALSRGARRCVFVELASRQVRLIRENLRLTGFEDRAEVYRNDVRRGLEILDRRDFEFDLIFCDPPYDKSCLYSSTLRAIAEHGLLGIDGVLVLEHAAVLRLEALPGGLREVRREEYGDTGLSFFKRENGGGEGDGKNGRVPGEL